MASTYSTILRLTYPTTGDLAGTWGTIVNTGVTALVEDALAGVASIAMADANYTLSANNGVSDEARKAFLQITGALTASRDIIIPAVTKAYTVTNATTGGFSVVVKPAAGTGVTIPNGSTYMVRCDGTNVVAMFTGFPYTGTQDFSGATLVTLPANTTIGNVSAAELAYLDGVTSAIQTQLNAKAPIASPTFTGTVTIPAGASIDGFAPLASPTFTGTVTIPSGASIAGFAPLASPALTGTPTAPTATAGTSTTQLATTAFVGATAFSAALPAQTGNAGKYVTTDGTNASWGTITFPVVPAGATIYTALNFGGF